jgi:hypothetical protein
MVILKYHCVDGSMYLADGSLPPIANTTLFVLASDYDALAAELAAVKEIRQHGCECSDDDACQFARDRDKAQADLLLARQRIAVLEAVLRCCLADPRIPTDLWRIIEPALATAETGVKP